MGNIYVISIYRYHCEENIDMISILIFANIAFPTLNNIRSLQHPKIITVANKNEDARLTINLQGTLDGATILNPVGAGILHTNLTQEKLWKNSSKAPICKTNKPDNLNSIVNTKLNKEVQNSIHLNEVLYSEGIGFNLMSAGKIVEAGYRVVLDSEGGEIRNKLTNKSRMKLNFENRTWIVGISPK